jgi:hypothetical protein
MLESTEIIMLIRFILLIEVFLIIEDIIVFLEFKSVDQFFFAVAFIENSFEILIGFGESLLAFLAVVLHYCWTLTSKPLLFIFLIDVHLDYFAFSKSELLGLIEGVAFSSDFGQIFTGWRFDLLFLIHFLG